MSKIQLGLLSVLTVLTVSCTSYKRDILYPASACAADTLTTISFSKNVWPIIQENCAISGCHTGSTPTGNLNMDSAVAYTNLLNSGSGYINTANPQVSLLYNKISTASAIMPPTGKMSDCNVNTILKWIEQNAKNN